MPNGHWGRLLRVDLTTRQVTRQFLAPATLRKYLGGVGLAARLLYDETDAATGPLSPSNPLVFAVGPLTGTRIPMTGRHAVAARSPLTGLWGESDCGGAWGWELKAAGYDGLVITGQSSAPVYLWIDGESVEIRDATHLWGLDCYEIEGRVRTETSPRAQVSAIGPAGEKLVLLAAIMHDGSHGRAAGRCGLGAVMGSKRLKAIAVRGDLRVPVADDVRLKATLRDIVPMIQKGTMRMHNYGTIGGLETIHALGDLPIKNWILGEWEAGALATSGPRLAETIYTGRYACRGCMVACGREVRIADGPHAGVEGAGPEYETAAAFGSLCLNDDLNAIAAANELCNRLGVDTISTGAAIAFAMECHELGFLGDAEGLDLSWGRVDTILELVGRIGRRQGRLGTLLGRGVRQAAAELGGMAEECAIHVKGLELPMHDPRAYFGMAASYATSARGACHLAGFTHPYERVSIISEAGFPQATDRFAWERKGELSAVTQDLMCLFDSLKLCKFAVFGGLTPTHMLTLLNAVTGWDTEMEMAEFLRTGERIANLKRLFNVRLGASRKDDTLPARILSHKRGGVGAPDALPPLGAMLSDFYTRRGWDEFGIPRPDKLAELGLP
jgi:aldehyde:ferredoxin oxidoreductase